MSAMRMTSQERPQPKAISKRLAWVAAGLLGAGLAANAAPAWSAVQTSHLATDAEARALVAANGGAFRFATELRQTEDDDGRLQIRPRPEKAPGDPTVTREIEALKDGQATPFSLTYNGQGRATLTVTPRHRERSVTNLPGFAIPSDFTELLLRVEAERRGARIIVSNLSLNGSSFPGTATATGGEPGALDILRLRGANLSGGFTLKGSIQVTWGHRKHQGGDDDDRDRRTDFQIWGAKVAVSDTAPPLVSIQAPLAGTLLATASPSIAATFSDSGSGVDPASVRLLLDGFDETAQATVGAAALAAASLSPLGEGLHTLAVLVRDRAGNEGRAEIGFTTDTQAPEIGFSAPAATVADEPSPAITLIFLDSVSGSDPATIEVHLDGSPITATCVASAAGANCLAPPLASGTHTLTARLRDRAGNLGLAEDRFSLDLDDVPPELAVVEPAEARVVGREALRLRLRFGDARSGTDLASLRVVVDGQDLTATCTVTAPFADCPAPHLARGAHLLSAQLSDRRGNRASAERAFDLALPVRVAFTAPEPESFSTAPVVRLEGTVSPEARTVRINGFDAVVQAGTFVLDGFPLRDGLNNLVAIAADEAGNTGAATLRVEADRTAPRLSVSAPNDGEVVATPEIAVLGRVNDLVTGTVGEEEVTVTVNGTAASVAQRGFLATAVPLAPGPNTLEIVAIDRGGNRSVELLTVTLAPPSGVRSLRADSGDGQRGPISAELPLPLVAAVFDAAGQPAAGVRVIFRIVGGSGHLANGRRAEAVTTGANGLASARLTLGSRAGAATDRVRAAVAGYAGEAVFVAGALPGPAAAIDVAVGDAQVAAPGTPLAQPLVALLTDGQQNPIVGAPVTFRAVAGDGRFPDGSTEIEIETDGSGLATVPFVLGSREGWEAYRIEASFPNRTGLPAVFLASGFPAADPAAIRISGVVLDNEDRPVPGVTLRLRDSAATALSDAAGRFTLAGVPPGQVFLIADASTTTRAGAWPNLEFELFAVPGLENSLPKPIYLLPLDLGRGVLVDETRGGRVTIPELPGFALDVAPGSVTFPGGSRSGLVSVTPVHADKVPMAPGSGMQPRLIVTIQPAGAHFDPPATLTLPNVDGLPPGTVTEMFSFDHDIGAFVSIGTGTVSEDGRVLRSDPGFGVEEAGWHCGARQSPSGANASLSLSIREKAREPVVFLLDDGGGVGSESGSALRHKAAGGGALTALGKPGTDSSYAWTVANPEIVSIFPEGEPLCSDSEVCATSALPNSIGETLATAKLFCPITGKSTTQQIRVVVAKVRLKEVSYSGATYRDVIEDGTTNAYAAPHWQDSSSPPDGDASDVGERHFPVSFEQNGKIAVSATWKIEPAVTPGAGILVRGEVTKPEGLVMTIPPTPATTAGSLVRLGTTQLTGQLPPGIGFLNPLKIAWQMSTDGGTTWINAGTSDNRVYVILGNPFGSTPLYETVLDIGCRNAAGKVDEDAAVDAIWADFANPIPGLKRKPVDGKNRPDGQEMRYWVNTSNPRLPDVGEQCQSLKAMLTLTPTDPELEGIGTCKAWSTLMQSTMQSIGISDVLRFEGRPKYFSPVPFGNTTRAHFLVNLWNLDRASVAQESCKLPGAVLLDEAIDLEGSPGQGTENPPAEFDNHYIIMHKKQVYDPSYGIGPFLGSSEMEALNAWENSAIAGFYLRCRILGEDGLPRDLDVVKKNDPLQLESSFFPPQLEPQ